MLAALLRPIFGADGREQARALVGDALERLRKPLPTVKPRSPQKTRKMRPFE